MLWEINGVVGMAQIPLSDTQLKALKPLAKRQNISAGHALFVVIEPRAKGGGKSFVGRTRFPLAGPASRWRSVLGSMDAGQGNGA